MKNHVEWPTVFLLLATYTLWAISGSLIWPHYPALALILMAVFAAQHASLVHEALHGHPTRYNLVNEMLVTMNIGLIWPYRRFKTLHMLHHEDERLTDPFDDPESYYRALWNYEEIPAPLRVILHINNTLVGRIILNPPLGTIGLILGDLRLIGRGDTSVLLAWVLHLVSVVPVVWCIQVWFGIPIWLYALTVAWGGASLISIRTYAEHQWSEIPEGRTIIVERTPLSLLFLNNNLHLVHHKHPCAPWYQLPGLYLADREQWQAMNKGYVFSNYWQLFRAYAFSAKEPVIHPVWHRSKPQ
ncbi:MAG: fatty acid desaturase [Rhodobacteraceae bacterium]|nr:fatty acid desaturase [Paracoccaceae bacterium]